jgi:hypothetical protein
MRSGAVGVPSIKGVAFQFVASAIERLVAEGKIERGEIEAKVAEEDRKILEGPPIPGLWYPVASFGRLLEFALEKDGRPREEWPQVGFEIARSLLAARTYEGMIEAASKRGDRSGLTLVHLVPLFMNFSSWSFEQGPDDGSVYHVNVEQAEALPDSLVAIAQGVIAYLSLRVRGYRVSVSSERPGRGRIVFRAVRTPGS